MTPKSKGRAPNEIASSDQLLEQIGSAVATQIAGSTMESYPLGDSELVPRAGVVVIYARNDQGRAVISAITLIGEWITSDMLRAVPLSWLENSQNILTGDWPPELTEIAELPPLRRADMSPDDFSKLVARHYRAWAAIDSNPAAAMSSKYGVKLPTIHGWIREARLRNHLAPARPRRSRGGN